MEEKTETNKKKKPQFLRKDWHKKIKLGSTVKKNRKWRKAKGIQNKIRLNMKGHSKKPRIGYGQDNSIKGLVNGESFKTIRTPKDLDSLKKGDSIIIGSIGLKKRKQILISKLQPLSCHNLLIDSFMFF